MSYGTLRAPTPTSPPPSDIVEVKLNAATKDEGKAMWWAKTNVLDTFHSEGIDCWLAGGSVRGILENVSAFNHHDKILQEVSDFDIYFPSTKEFDRADLLMRNIATGATKIRSTPKSEKYRVGDIMFDLVNVPYEDGPVDCIRSFDFTVCCGAIYKGTLYHHKDYYKHIATKTIELMEIQNPVAAIVRLQKYAKKGFEASNDTILTIARDIAMLDPGSDDFTMKGLY